MMKGLQTKKLSEVCEKITDGTHQTPTYFDDGVLFLSSRNVTSGTIDWEKVKYIDAKQHGEMQRRVSPRLNDILPAKNGTTGVAAMVDRDVPFDIYVSLALRRPLAAVRPTFLLHFINSPLAKEQFTKRLKGIGVPNLHLDEIREVEMPVPPLTEQQRIVGLLDEAFEGIATAKANAEKNLQNARALFESRLQSVFTQRGPGWVETTLEKVLATQPQNGWSPPAANHSASGTPVLTLSSVTGFKFRPDKVKFTSASTDSKKKYWVKNGDFLITRSNTPELVGHVAIASGIEKPTIYPDLIMRMNPIPERAMTEFLYYHLRTPALRTEIMGRAQGANPTMKKISNGAVKTLPIAVPPIAPQQVIVETLNNLTEETHRLARLYERKLAALEALKKSLLHKAFTGQL